MEHYALQVLRQTRVLTSAEDLGYTDSDLQKINHIKAFYTKYGYRYLFAPHGVYDKNSLRECVKQIWPRGLSRENLKDAYKFINFDIDAIGREESFMIISDVLFYRVSIISYREDIAACVSNILCDHGG